MRYKAKDYATALAELVIDSKVDKKKIMDRFLDLLKKNNDMGKAKKIVAESERIILNKKGNKKVVLQMAREIDNKNIVKSFSKEGDVVEKEINPALIAGVKVIINGEKQLDFSLKHKLEKMF